METNMRKMVVKLELVVEDGEVVMVSSETVA